MLTNSGYHNCPCRDCFEIAIGCDDHNTPHFCNSCEDAGCDLGSECRAEGAYGGSEATALEQMHREARRHDCPKRFKGDLDADASWLCSHPGESFAWWLGESSTHLYQPGIIDDAGNTCAGISRTIESCFAIVARYWYSADTDTLEEMSADDLYSHLAELDAAIGGAS